MQCKSVLDTVRLDGPQVASVGFRDAFIKNARVFVSLETS